MINTIQLQPHTASTIPLHVESPATLSARTAVEIHVQESLITNAIMATLTRNDETGQILIPTLTLTELAQKKFLPLEMLEPHSFRDYVLTLEPINNPPSSLQRQSTLMEITYGIEAIAPLPSQQISPLQTPIPTPTPSSPTPNPNIQDPQVLGITTAQASTQSAIQFNAPPKPPPIFFILLFTCVALVIALLAKNLRFVTRAKKTNVIPTRLKTLLLQ